MFNCWAAVVQATTYSFTVYRCHWDNLLMILYPVQKYISAKLHSICFALYLENVASFSSSFHCVVLENKLLNKFRCDVSVLTREISKDTLKMLSSYMYMRHYLYILLSLACTDAASRQGRQIEYQLCWGTVRNVAELTPCDPVMLCEFAQRWCCCGLCFVSSVFWHTAGWVTVRLSGLFLSSHNVLFKISYRKNTKRGPSNRGSAGNGY